VFNAIHGKCKDQASKKTQPVILVVDKGEKGKVMT
jgi:hypothetical protein